MFTVNPAVRPMYHLAIKKLNIYIKINFQRASKITYEDTL